LVSKLRAKTPADRPQTADELARALERIDLSGDWRAPAASHGSRRRTMAIAAAGAIAGAAGGGRLGGVRGKQAPHKGDGSRSGYRGRGGWMAVVALPRSPAAGSRHGRRRSVSCG